MGGGGERINSLADLVPDGRDGERIIPGLRDYLSDSLGLQTDSTIGNESNQLPKNPTSEKPTEISPKRSRKRSVLVRGDKMSIPQLLAEASR